MSKSIKKSVKSIARTLQSVIENLEGHENGFANLVESIDDLGEEQALVQQRLTALEQAIESLGLDKPEMINYCREDVEATAKLFKANLPSGGGLGTVTVNTSETFSDYTSRMRRLQNGKSDDNSFGQYQTQPRVHKVGFPEHTFLVAYTVYGRTRSEAEANLHASLRGPEELREVGLNDVTSYWIAEDDRAETSDCDSAVFVHPGNQDKAEDILSRLGMARKPITTEPRTITNPCFTGEEI